MEEKYAVSLNTYNKGERDKPYCLFDFNLEEEIDKVDLYFLKHSKPNQSCRNVIDWWAETGQKKYPNLAALACDSLMAMGSSIPSEVAFSQAGGIVTDSQSRLSDNNLEILMKLCLWNCLFMFHQDP